MRSTAALRFALPVLFFYTFFAAAWPWPPRWPEASNELGRRADGNSDSSSAASSTTSTASSRSKAAASTAASTASPTASASSESKSSSESTHSSDDNSKTKSSDSKTTKSSSTAHHNSKASPTPSVPANAAAGGISMLTPAATQTTYFKIGEDITFQWNYTSLLVSPSAIDVVASNTAGSWTLTANASIKETGSVVWRTSEDLNGQNPLLTDTYTLVVYDAAEGATPTAVPRPGHLSSYMNFQFGMYLPQLYTPLAEIVCTTCSAAMSDAERQTMRFLFGMVGVTLLSFAWFAGDFLGAF